MVNVVGFSDRERAEKEKHTNLVAITRAEIGQEKMAEMADIGIVVGGAKEIYVALTDNEVKVYDPNYFGLAMHLAEMYEKQTGEGFTLKKEYPE
mgnify:CR=1 FL=1